MDFIVCFLDSFVASGEFVLVEWVSYIMIGLVVVLMLVLFSYVVTLFVKEQNKNHKKDDDEDLFD